MEPLNFSFRVVEKEHEEMFGLLRAHQRALVGKNIETASSILDGFAEKLRGHIRFEEEGLLPVFVRRKAEIPGCTAQLITAEHAKLLSLLREISDRCRHLRGAADLTDAILDLLERETLFKGILEHHAMRESNLLFPGLDVIATNEERAQMLNARFAAGQGGTG